MMSYLIIRTKKHTNKGEKTMKCKNCFEETQDLVSCELCGALVCFDCVQHNDHYDELCPFCADCEDM